MSTEGTILSTVGTIYCLQGFNYVPPSGDHSDSSKDESVHNPSKKSDHPVGFRMVHPNPSSQMGSQKPWTREIERLERFFSSEREFFWKLSENEAPSENQTRNFQIEQIEQKLVYLGRLKGLAQLYQTNHALYDPQQDPLSGEQLEEKQQPSEETINNFGNNSGAPSPPPGFLEERDFHTTTGSQNPSSTTPALRSVSPQVLQMLPPAPPQSQSESWEEVTRESWEEVITFTPPTAEKRKREDPTPGQMNSKKQRLGNEPPPTPLAGYLSEIMNNRRIPVKDFAKKIGVSKSTFFLCRNGKNSIGEFSPITWNLAERLSIGLKNGFGIDISVAKLIDMSERKQG